MLRHEAIAGQLIEHIELPDDLRDQGKSLINRMREKRTGGLHEEFVQWIDTLIRRSAQYSSHEIKNQESKIERLVREAREDLFHGTYFLHHEREIVQPQKNVELYDITIKYSMVEPFLDKTITFELMSPCLSMRHNFQLFDSDEHFLRVSAFLGAEASVVLNSKGNDLTIHNNALTLPYQGYLVYLIKK